MQSTSKFLYPEITKQVSCSLQFGLTCALRGVVAPGDWLSALCEAVSGRVLPPLFIGFCVQGTQWRKAFPSRVRNVSRGLRVVFTSGDRGFHPLRDLRARTVRPVQLMSVHRSGLRDSCR